MTGLKKQGDTGFLQKIVANPAQRKLFSQAPCSRKAYQRAFQLAEAGTPLLIRGAAGTGKLELARALQVLRKGKNEAPSASLHCSKWSSENTLLFREIERESVTRVIKRKSTQSHLLILQEVSELSESAQFELLKCLQALVERGENNLQVIATTREDLEAQVRAGSFHRELFELLSQNEIFLSPLADRPEDIEAFAHYFFMSLRDELERTDLKGVAEDVFSLLSAYSWPGNLAELRGALYQAIVVAQGPLVETHDLPQRIMIEPKGQLALSHRLSQISQKVPQLALPELPACGIQLSLELARMESALLNQAMEKSSGSLSGAARLLGLSVQALEIRLRVNSKFNVA